MFLKKLNALTGEHYRLPTDGSAWKSRDCTRHMLRGGAGTSYPRYLRASNRYWNLSAFLRDDVGVRLVGTP